MDGDRYGWLGRVLLVGQLVLAIANRSPSFSCRKKRRSLRSYDDGGGLVSGEGIYVFDRFSDWSEYGFNFL
jgi:hypothetical protein